MVRIPLNFDVIIITHPFLDVRFLLCQNERKNAFLDHNVNQKKIKKIDQLSRIGTKIGQI